jgi:AbrB family looped-hinge helix DNA binding protein
MQFCGQKTKLIPLFPLLMPDKLIAVIKISKRGSSLRITLPKEIAEKLNVTGSEHIGFYEVDGEIVVRKIE